MNGHKEQAVEGHLQNTKRVRQHSYGPVISLFAGSTPIHQIKLGPTPTFLHTSQYYGWPVGCYVMAGKLSRLAIPTSTAMLV